MQNTLENEIFVKNDQVIETSGFYCYDDHVSQNGENCFIPKSSYLMYFKKGDIGTKLGSCPHDVNWKLISPQ